ncbi:MAG: mannitol dehydrogenase family protein [Paraglaciecola sp.]|uniref:mannitol dehydrogenase family protein n=1 Tax=Paraglaciecola sp. TaxID=1920173 RepID=UPI003298E4BF
MKEEQLSVLKLSEINNDVDVPSYDLASITSGIVHFGAGNFHRAHQAVYCHSLLNMGETKWGITGVSLHSSAMRDNLVPQDYLYTVATLGGSLSFQVIGVIQKILVGPEKPQAVIDIVAEKQTLLVTTTITEKGYYLNSGEIDIDNEDIANDLKSIESPKTTYGYLAAACIKRSLIGAGPLTILCCDNMQAGGTSLENGVKMLLARHSPDTLIWLAENVAFISSMVDRVTPATDQKLKEKVAAKLNLLDAAPVAAEPFSQWIIEDRFAGVRPPFDKVGALFVEDITPFEQVKLRFLNAGHSMLASIGYLAGDQYVHQVLQRPAIARFVENTLKLNVMPVTPVPKSVNSEVYIDQVLERFRNRNLPYALLQVGTDSSQKIQQRWFPSIDNALMANGDSSYLALCIAAWVCFIQKSLLEGDLNDPLKEQFTNCVLMPALGNIEDFLSLAGAQKFKFFNNSSFMASVKQFCSDIVATDVEQTITTFINN